jgi:Putative auto-transporter adhesin, head GIN domain
MTATPSSSFPRKQEPSDFSSRNDHALHAKDTRPAPLQGRRVSLLAAASVAVALAACGDINITIGDSESSVKGSGVAATETRAVSPFTAIDATGIGKLKLRVGENDSLKVTADDNLLPLIKTEVRDGVLVLSTKGVSRSKTDIVFEATAKTIKRLENSGTVSIDAKGFNGGELQVEASGVGSITLAGRVDSLSAQLSGVGSLEAESLAADRVKTDLSGVGSASVRAEKSISGTVSGVGSLVWKGAATDVSTNVSGIGRVSKG